ncbi:gluconokinase [Schizosaccharomyces cryophilus OY26]|uniref:Gluconokinase n=1 Tax=Schizosaccharomyces cryophilus (strain OY26 / ATCC MYA-4695 / CBS 11777 / NBRC 106824 / NRRL Y48691) TaxID=653667 RepID=S9XD99_SCHCR|nr:gluconokinase [Schizosaccharomyces cryophilus OY26]EPY51811.1 gluconokinase [Schizosaccharomyces cryophilus OY26]
MSLNPHMLEKKAIFFIIGPSGSGKTTMAKFLADKLSFEYIEGDDLHPKANIEKMGSGQPLNDEDRWGWLYNCGGACAMQLDDPNVKGIVMTCSALKCAYRNILRDSLKHRPGSVHFIYLMAPKEVLIERTSARKNHYMKADMVESQLRDMQAPKDDEKDAYTLNVNKPPEESKDDCFALAKDILKKEETYKN